MFPFMWVRFIPEDISLAPNNISTMQGTSINKVHFVLKVEFMYKEQSEATMSLNKSC